MVKQIKRKYWFYIDNYVHISKKKDWILFYNPYNGKILEYLNNLDVSRLVSNLLKIKHMRTILLSHSDLEQAEIRKFIEKIREHFMGDLIDVAYSKKKPVQMSPIVKIHQNIAHLKKDEMRSVGEKVIDYLSDVWIYLNNTCDKKCIDCRRAYLQFPFCTTKNQSHQELSLPEIRQLFFELQGSKSLNIHFLGGNILKYSKLEQLLDITVPNMTTHFYLHYLNAEKNSNHLKTLATCAGNLKILVSFPLNKRKFQNAVDSLVKIGNTFEIVFSIKSNKEFEEANIIYNDLKPGQVNFHPIYDGANLDFFYENLFIEKDDIEVVRPSLKDIYTRSEVNPIYFGNLTLLPDGRYYSNLNIPSIGKLGKESLYEILFKELLNRRSWRKIRKHVSPCKSCVFETLCPPISNYNYVIGKYNLCHIKP